MKQYKDLYLIKRLVNVYVKKYYFRIFIAIAFTIIIAMCNALQVQMISPLLDKGFVSDDYSYLMIIATVLFIIGIIRGVGIYIQQVFMQKATLMINKDIQIDIYDSLVRSDVEYLEYDGTSQHMTRFSADTSNIGGLISDFFVHSIKESFTAIFMLAVMFYNSPIMTITAVIILPLFFIPVLKLAKRLENIYLDLFEKLGMTNSTLDDTLKGIREVKSYNIQNFVKNWVATYFTKSTNLNYKITRTTAMARPIMEFSVATMLAVGLFWGGYMVIEGDLTIGELMAFYVALIAVQRPLKGLADLSVAFKSGTASLKRVFDIIDKKPKIKNIKNAKDLKVKKGNIKIEKVSFSYANKIKVLKDVNIDVMAGKSIAIVGESGSGKSSLVNLINRFTEATTGKIKIDGVNIKTVTLESLHKNIAVVGQAPTLFNTTIRENVAFGNLDATDEQLIKALKQASAWDFVRKSKKGLDTLVGERGLQLSGGQRQRIAIARAFLKDAPILILDEATSALDTKSEAEILTTLNKLKQGRTTITIAHRISTIMNADKIFVMAEGKVVETGTHKQLKAKNGIYAELSKNIK